MKSNVALIGFMGVGKSAIGRLLALRLGKKLVNVDLLISARVGKSIPQIFWEQGESGFREFEVKMVEQVAAGKDLVIDCGGGVVLNPVNIDRLRQSSIIVWLTASPEVILQRTAREGGGRPLLQGKSTLEDIRSLLELRKPYYEKAADIQVDTSSPSLDGLVDLIIEKLKENADFN
jgi:shikimate kinase